MREAAKWFAVTVIGAVAVLAVAFGLSRWRGAPPDQRAALAEMRKPTALPGDNAFEAMWLLPYDVPEAERAALVDEDARALAQWLEGAATPGSAPASTPPAPYRSVAATRYGVDSAGEPLPMCGEGCLAAVEADLDAMVERSRAQAGLVARVRELSRYSHYRNLLPAHPATPFPDLGGIARARTAHAVAFAQGSRLEAIDGVCSEIAGWRRLLPNSESLIVAMVAAGSTERLVELFADMLARMPAGAPLPPSCEVAFAPLQAEDGAFCNAMTGEFQWTQTALRSGALDTRTFAFDPEATAARSAQVMRFPCSEAATAARLADRPVRSPYAGLGMMRLECIANYAGCVMSDIAAPAYEDYPKRGMDHRAHLRVGAALMWLHREGAGADALGRLPATLQAGRAIEAIDGRMLRIELFGRSASKEWRVPLPSSHPSVRAATGEAGAGRTVSMR